MGNEGAVQQGQRRHKSWGRVSLHRRLEGGLIMPSVRDGDGAGEREEAWRQGGDEDVFPSSSWREGARL